MESNPAAISLARRGETARARLFHVLARVSHNLFWGSILSVLFSETKHIIRCPDPQAL